MGRQLRRRPFAELVREVRQTPVAPVVDDALVTDPTGTRWRETRRDIAPAEALELASAGAAVAWDSCGCGGHCPWTWFTAAEVARLVRTGPPRVRRKGHHHERISVYAADGGRVLVVAEGTVRWGDLITG